MDINQFINDVKAAAALVKKGKEHVAAIVEFIKRVFPEHFVINENYAAIERDSGGLLLSYYGYNLWIKVQLESTPAVLEGYIIVYEVPYGGAANVLNIISTYWFDTLGNIRLGNKDGLVIMNREHFPWHLIDRAIADRNIWLHPQLK